MKETRALRQEIGEKKTIESWRTSSTLQTPSIEATARWPAILRGFPNIAHAWRTEDFTKQTVHGHILQANFLGRAGDFSTGYKEIRRGTQTRHFEGGSLGGVNCQGENCTLSSQNVYFGFTGQEEKCCQEQSQETTVHSGSQEVLWQTAGLERSMITGQVKLGSAKRTTGSFLMLSEVTGRDGDITDHGMTFHDEASTKHVLTAGESTLNMSGWQAAKLQAALSGRSRNLLLPSSSAASTAADTQAVFQEADINPLGVKKFADSIERRVEEAATNAPTSNLFQDAKKLIDSKNQSDMLLKDNQKALMEKGFGISARRAHIAIERGHEAGYKVLATRGAEEIGHGKISSSETSGSTSHTLDVMGTHQHVKLDAYGLAEMSTCYGQSRDVVTTSDTHPQHSDFWSSSKGHMTSKTEEQIDGVIRSINVAGRARKGVTSGNLLQRFTAQGESHERSWGFFTKEKLINVVEERSGTVENGERSLQLGSQKGLQEESRSCLVDYRRKVVRLDSGSGSATVSDEGLFLRTEQSGKGYYDRTKEEIVLEEGSEKEAGAQMKTSLSSHSCQGVAGGVGAVFRHVLNGGELDKECAKAAAKSAAYSWGMSVLTQTCERRVAGSGSACFAVINAAQQSLAALRDPTKTRMAKTGGCRKCLKSHGSLGCAASLLEEDDGFKRKCHCACG